MPDKKSDQPEQSADEKELEHRVDAMMSTELPETALPTSAPETKKTDGKKSTGTAAKDRKTAPKPPPKLPKSIKVDEAPKPEEPDPMPGDSPVSLVPEAPSQATMDEVPAALETRAEPAQDQTREADPLEDSGTDEAVDDIVAHEGDTVLAVNDALAARQEKIAEASQSRQRHFKHKWFWFLVLVIILGTAIDLFIFLSG